MSEENKFDKKKLLESFQKTQKLPADPNELAKTVFAIYKYGLEAFSPWHEESDKYRKYYRGEARPSKPKFASNINHNVVYTNIETAKPILENALTKPGIYSTTPDDVGAAEMLEKRTALAWKESGVQVDKSAMILHDTLVDGTCYLKTVVEGDGCKIIRVDNRRIMHDPEVSDFDDSVWIIDAVLGSIGETELMFGGKSPQTNYGKELDTKNNTPMGPPNTDKNADEGFTSLGTHADAIAQAVERPGNANGLTFEKAEKVLRIEFWVKDLTEGEEGQLKYPHGRVVTVGVGSNGDGTETSSKDPDLMVLADINNPHTTYYERKQKFPIVQIQCHNIGEVWGLSEVFNQIDSQDMINDILNATHDNWKLTNNVTKIVNEKSGVTEEMLTNAPGNVIIVNGNTDPKSVIHTEFPASIAHTTLPFLQTYLQLNERESGAADVIAGRRPTGVTSGTAIEQLQEKADNKFIFIARSINTAFVKAYYALAACIQDFEDEKVFMPKDMEEEVEPEDQFEEFDPEQVKGVAFRVETTRQMKQSTVIQLLQVAAQLDQAVPGAGTVVLDYADDKRLKHLYRKILDENRKQAEAAAKQQKELADADAAKEITLESMKNNGRKQPE